MTVSLLVCWTAAACSVLKPSEVPTATPGANQTLAEIEASSAREQVIQAKVDDLVSRMTLDEKIGQMTQLEKGSITPGEIARYFVGSVLSGGGGAPSPNTAEGWAAMVNSFQQEALTTRLAIPLIYGADAVHGHGNLYGATIFPQEIALGATLNADLVRRIGQATAEEMLATGTQWNFAPVVAVPQDIRWGRTYESYAEDTALVSQLAAAYVEGLQTLPEGYSPAEGQTLYTLATPKHFLGDGGTTLGTSTQFYRIQFLLDQGDMRYTDAEVRKLFLPPYQAAVESGAMSIMISYSSWNGEKMHGSKYWITDVLKGELGFEGFVVSDWAGIDQVGMTYYESVVTAINAGIDMSMVPTDVEGFTRTMKQAVINQDIPIERIDDAVRRILTVKYKLGLFEHPFSDPMLLSTVGSDAHRSLARQAVRESLVLLKNSRKILPLEKNIPLIYVAGVAADDIGIQCGGWTIEWQGKIGDIVPGTTILQGIKDAISQNSKIEFRPAGDFTDKADLGIAVVGEMPYAEGIGDRKELSLSDFDRRMIENLREHSKKLVVILISGRPMVISDVYPLADAWVAAWLPGSEGAGVADVLFGDYPFVGRLPFTWPRSNDQLPVNKNNVKSTSGCSSPLFPYGYGLGEAGSRPIKWMDCAVEED